MLQFKNNICEPFKRQFVFFEKIMEFKSHFESKKILLVGINMVFVHKRLAFSP